jgi:hypothetical protein
MVMGDARRRRGSLLGLRTPARALAHAPGDDPTFLAEAVPVPARLLGVVLRHRRLDRDACLVRRRAERLFDEDVRDVVRAVTRSDGKDVDRPDETTGPDGRPEGEDRRACDLPPRLRDEHRRLREEDELTEEIGRIERARVTLCPRRAQIAVA